MAVPCVSGSEIETDNRDGLLLWYFVKYDFKMKGNRNMPASCEKGSEWEDVLVLMSILFLAICFIALPDP